MWEKAAEIPGDQTRGTAPNLTEGEEYQFRVIAVNQAGPGEPSEPSGSVIAKPRFGEMRMCSLGYRVQFHQWVRSST